MKRKNMVVGMAVVVKASEDQMDYAMAPGQGGTITQLEPPDHKGYYCVQIKVAGDYFWFKAEAIKPAVKKEKTPLKVGDKVQEKVETNFDAGTVLEVDSVDLLDPGMPYLALSCGGVSRWYSRDALRRVKSK